MNRTIKATLAAVCISAAAGFGLTSCNTGTDPGETNTERSDIKYPEDRVMQSGNVHHQDTAANADQYYEGRRGTAAGDSAYIQGGAENREKRGEHNKEGLRGN